MSDAAAEVDDWATLFFRDRRLLSLTICLIVVAGLAALHVLPRMEDPVLTQRAALVTTLFSGANAERVESLVTEKLEAEIQEIEEIKEIRSVSRDGISLISIELKDTVLRDESEEVWSRLRDKLADAAPILPRTARRSEFEKLNITAYALIVSLVWEIDDHPNYAILRRYAEELDDRLRSVAGTKQVDLFGNPSEEVLVTIRQAELIQRQMTVAEVADRLAASDAKESAGQQRGEIADYLLEIGDEFDSLARIRRTPIQFGPSGQSVALGDIGSVTRTVTQPLTSMCLVDGKPAISLGAIVLPTKRVDQWFDDVHEALAEFETRVPDGVSLQVRFEQDTYVRGRLVTLSGNLLLGGVAVVAVIGLMMGWRSAIVVGMTLPLASLMVLAGLNFLKIPLHQMSITGLIIALGLLIDNAIVMADEVRDRIRWGSSPTDSVRQAVSHLVVPLFGSTVTTALSFAPIALMPGPAGEFVGSIAISVLIAIFSSFLLAMTITPALAALIEPNEPRSEPGSWYQGGIRNAWLTCAYLRLLRSAYRRPVLTVVASVMLPIVGFGLGTTLTEQFFPPADRDQVNLQVELPATASISATQSTVKAARSMMLEVEQVAAVDWYLGESAPSFYYNMLANQSGASQYAQALVRLRHSEGAREFIHDLQNRLDREFPQARFLVRQLEQGPPFEAPIEVRIFGPDLDRLRTLGNKVRRVLAATPEVVHVTTNLGEMLPAIKLDIDEEKARLAGISQLEIARQLETTLEGAVGGLVLEETEELPVRVRLDNDVRGDLNQIASLQLITQSAEGTRRAVPLSNLAEIGLQPRVPSILRFNTQRMNEIRGYITAGTLPAQVLKDFRSRIAASGFELPDGYRLVFAGESSKRNEAVGNLLSSIGVLIVLMIATLVLSFSSYRIAVIVGLVAVLSVGLSLGALAIFGYPFGFMAIVGTMGLIGVAINDTIVVLAAIRDDGEARRGDPDAIAGVVLRSTRHVLATTLTTIAGFLPLIAGGGGFWPPLATSIAGGVAGATVLALFFGPCCYSMLMCREVTRCRDAIPPSVIAQKNHSVRQNIWILLKAFCRMKPAEA